MRRSTPSYSHKMPDVRRAQCFIPFVRRAEGELAGSQCTGLLSDECLQRLFDVLLSELVACGQDVVDRELAKRLESRNPLYGFDIRLAPRALVDEAEMQVIAQFEQENGQAIDDRAPLLRMVLDRRTDCFVASTRELCERIERDRTLLENALFAGCPLGVVTSLEFSDADSHDGGRRTCIITCKAGRFVYKPHDCAIDKWFHGLVERCLPDALHVPDTLVCEDGLGPYGYCEFVDHDAVLDEAGISRFWRRMGKACALFYLLGSQDLHGGNFVAHGEYPSLVDVETVLSPKPIARGNALTCPNVMRSLGGFTADFAQTLVTSGIFARFDSNKGNLSPFFARLASCLPLWNGREYDVSGFEDEVLAGFVEGCDLLLDCADAIRREIVSASAASVRWIVRPTDVYGKLLRRLGKADAYDAGKRAEILAILKRPFEVDCNDAESSLVACETACLLEGDVPSFRVKAGSVVVQAADGRMLDGLLSSSAVDRALKRIEESGPGERGFALAVLDANLRFAEVEEDGSRIAHCEPCSEALEVEAAQAEAESIFESLERMAVTSSNGGTSWLFRSYAQRTLTEPGNGFANGVWGMAPFFAALAQTTLNEEIRERATAHLMMCLGRMDEVLACLSFARRIPEQSVSLGLVAGFGGMLRALTLVNEICEEPDVRKRTERMALDCLAPIARSDIEHAKHASVYSGCAGLLLALCQCPLLDGSEGAAKAIERLAKRLDALRVLKTDDGRAVWKTSEKNWAISGFGNGVAGIGAALAAAESRGVRCSEAARTAFSWERSVFEEALGTWPDFRELPISSGYVHGICSGAPGVGLAAVMANSSGDSELSALAADLTGLADAACRTLPPGFRDTLCCGSGSLVEYWLARGCRDDAGRLLAGVVRRKRDIGFYVFQGRGRRQSDDPSLFFGLSGMGYNLLRYANPSLPGIFI